MENYLVKRLGDLDESVHALDCVLYIQETQLCSQALLDPLSTTRDNLRTKPELYNVQFLQCTTLKNKSE